MKFPKATVAALACVLLTNPVTVASSSFASSSKTIAVTTSVASGESALITGAPLDDTFCGPEAASTVTVHDVKTVFVTVGGGGVHHNGAQAAFDAQVTTSASVNNNGKDGTKSVTVTRTIEHIKPVTKTVTSTKKNGKVITKTVEATITSTEIRTVTAAPTPTTIISTKTLDEPTTVTATVTEEGKEVIKTTEVFTQVVTITSDVVHETQVSTTTDLGTGTTTSGAASATESTQSSSNSTDVSGSGPSGSSNSTSTDDDPQTSLTLDSQEIMTSLFSNGNPSEGQAPALTSHNNFINFCLTENVPITNGEQIKTGSCDPVPMGHILSTDRMPSSTFIYPPNFGSIDANTTFTIQMKIQNLVTGNFVNAKDNYYAAPAQVDETGTLIGHSHVTVESLDAFDQPDPTNPNTFAFFKGFNDAAVNGILSAVVTGGLPSGKYRISSINSAANHQPCLVSVAQHGTLDAFGYFTVL